MTRSLLRLASSFGLLRYRVILRCHAVDHVEAAAKRAHPQPASRVLGKRRHVSRSQSIQALQIRRDMPELPAEGIPVVDAAETRADPEEATPVLPNRH